MATVNETLAADLAAEIEALEATEVAVATNEGTFGSVECCRKIGTGRTEAGTYTVYERVGGGRRVQGRDPQDAPGYERTLDSGDRLGRLRERLADLRGRLREARRGR